LGTFIDGIFCVCDDWYKMFRAYRKIVEIKKHNGSFVYDMGQIFPT
jgi:hypothetical protein